MSKKRLENEKEKLKALENEGRLYLDGEKLAEKAYWNKKKMRKKLQIIYGMIFLIFKEVLKKY